MEEFKIVNKDGYGEIVEKKSRFIASVARVESEEAAQEYIEKKKKEYWDARHNCYAFIIGNKAEIKRFSDDGEPAGTAGKPILDILETNNIRNAVIVVTRYFGGTLLGTGGLIRAYSQASKEGIKNAEILTKLKGIHARIQTNYNDIGKIEYIARQMGITEYKVSYTDKVEIEVMVRIQEYNLFESKVTEATNGKAIILDSEQTYFTAKEAINN